MSCLKRQFLACFVLLCGVTQASLAQEVRASISGIVADPTGAPIAEAKVTVTNTANNASIVAMTNEAGSYLTPYLPPGSYVPHCGAGGV